MTVNLLNGKQFTEVKLVGQTPILCTIIPNQFIKNNELPSNEIIEEYGIIIPWTSILYIT